MNTTTNAPAAALYRYGDVDDVQCQESQLLGAVEYHAQGVRRERNELRLIASGRSEQRHLATATAAIEYWSWRVLDEAAFLLSCQDDLFQFWVAAGSPGNARATAERSTWFWEDLIRTPDFAVLPVSTISTLHSYLKDANAVLLGVTD